MRTTDQKLKEAEIIMREVKSMRTFQKAYFQARWEKDEARKTSLLEQSKLQEKKVDEMIRSYTESNESKLF